MRNPLAETSGWWRALVSLAAFAAVYGLAVCTPLGQQLDVGAFALVPPLAGRFGGILSVVRLAFPIALSLVVIVLAVLGAIHRRWRLVIAVAVGSTVGPLLAVVAKTLLPRPGLGDNGYDWNTFPSGHMAVTMALVCAVSWLWPSSALRPARNRWYSHGVVLLVLATAYGWGLVVTFAHRPADVVGGTLLVAATAAAAFAAAGLRVAVPPRAWRDSAIAACGGVLLELLSSALPHFLPAQWVGAAGVVLLLGAACRVPLSLTPSVRGVGPDAGGQG